jgi:hypothetical protein
MTVRKGLLPAIVLLTLLAACGSGSQKDRTAWIDQPQDQWPQIAMVNEIEYVDQYFPVAGCAFLLDTGSDTVAATAKHLLIYFKSDSMETVSFDDDLVRWIMHPKYSPGDSVVVGHLINEDPTERIIYMPSRNDWLLFEIEERSPRIEPLRFREKPFKKGEAVFIIGWRYTDLDRPQVIYEGALEGWENGELTISTLELADNTIPGLSGAPVIDSDGRLIGLMSQKDGELERLAGLDYAREVLKGRTKRKL